MTHTPRVTVVITTYNRADLLPRAVESVLAQTYTDYEVIIVDDCSSDNTQDVVAGFDDPRIRSFRHERNRGASAARNTGILNAKGEYVAFLDDDDELLPMNLEARVHRMDSGSCEVGLVYGWRDEVDDSTGDVRLVVRDTLEGELFEHLLALNFVAGTLDIMVRKSIALEVDGFDERLGFGEDVLFVALAAQRCHMAVVPRVVANSHIGHGHLRITDLTFDRSLRELRFLRVHLHTFAKELGKRPKVQTTVLRRLALLELRCRNWRASLLVVAASLRVDPLGTICKGARYCVRSCYRRLQVRWAGLGRG